MSKIVATSTVWTSLQNFFRPRSTELWGESRVTLANMSFIYQLPKNLISSQTQYTVVSQVFAFF